MFLQESSPRWGGGGGDNCRGQDGRGLGEWWLRGSPRSFSPRLPARPGFILAKFCEEPVDLRAPGAQAAPAAALRGGGAGVSRDGGRQRPLPPLLLPQLHG